MGKQPYFVPTPRMDDAAFDVCGPQPPYGQYGSYITGGGASDGTADAAEKDEDDGGDAG